MPTSTARYKRLTRQRLMQNCTSCYPTRCEAWQSEPFPRPPNCGYAHSVGDHKKTCLRVHLSHSLASRVVSTSESFVAAAAKITSRDLPSQVESVGKLKRVCMLKAPTMYAWYVCMLAKHVCMFAKAVCMDVKHVCMFAKLVCMYATLVCISGKKSCSRDEVRFVTKTSQYLTFNSIFQDL